MNLLKFAADNMWLKTRNFSSHVDHKLSENMSRLVAITGCDSGLGYSLAMWCRKKHHPVVAGVLDKRGPGAENLLREGVNVVALDVTQKQSIANFSSELEGIVTKKQTKLHAVINNAGILTFGETDWQTPSMIERQVSVNILGPILVTKSLMRLLRKDHGRVINVSSHCALETLPGISVYGCSKAATHAWTTGLRAELRKYGIHVVAVIPGNMTSSSLLLAGQTENFEIMKANMTAEQRTFYGEYFQQFARNFSAAGPKSSELKVIENQQIYDLFDKALSTPNPSPVYKCEPFRYTFYYNLFKILPTSLRDIVAAKYFVRLPSWTRPEKNSSSPTVEYYKKSEAKLI